MNRAVIFGGLAVFGLLVLTSSEGKADVPHGIPTGNGLALRKAVNPAEVSMGAHIGQWPDALVITVDDEIVPIQGYPGDSVKIAGEPVKLTELQVKAWSKLNSAWAQRRMTLPPDADKRYIDGYSNELYFLPSWLFRPLNAGPAYYATFPVDEYGRIKKQDYTGAGDVFSTLLANPLFKAVMTSALVASGPYGVAAYGAYTMWQARGSELTLKNMALQSARAYAVSQCGEGCGIAFDFGVGVASGKSVDTAAEDALYDSMTPEQRAYFQQGRKLARDVL